MVRSEGGRILGEEDDRWAENAWDHMKWGTEQERFAAEAIELQKASPVPQQRQDEYNGDPASFWDEIYRKVTDTMYKDRKWLCDEFPELAQAIESEAGHRVIAELGCGPGNTAFPLLEKNQNTRLKIHALDFSERAVSMVRAHPLYGCGMIDAAVWDVADPAGLPQDVSAGSVDIVIAIFVLSALHPSQWTRAVTNISQMLKPGGVLLFRDYGRHDLVQLRFKQARLMEDNLYVRGDGTRVYFFTQHELEGLFRGDFDQVQLEIDRRLLLNRKRKVQMWRCWVQACWRKKAHGHDDDATMQVG